MAMMMACQTKTSKVMIPGKMIDACVEAIVSANAQADSCMVARGVSQVAEVWNESDGGEDAFKEFVVSSYAGSSEKRAELYDRIAYILEQCGQSGDMLNNILQEPTTLVGKGEPTLVDWIISGYNPMAHFVEDMFANKVAHVCILNFPYYTLEEKNKLGTQWSREEWAYARMGDVFRSRVPGGVLADCSQVLSQAENYIAGYNIMMHCLRNEQGEQLWEEPMALLSHWNLRDELE